MRNQTICRVRCFSGIALVIAGAWSTDASTENPYEYDVSEFVRSETNRMDYRETASIVLTLEEPAALALMPSGGVAVAGSSEVVLLNDSGSETSRFPLQEAARCMAFASTGELLVGFRDHVQALDATGGVRTAWVSLGERAVLTSIAVGGGNVYLADSGNRVVWRFDESGRMRGNLAADGWNGRKPFIVPSPWFDVVADDQGVWVVNPGRQKIAQYSHDGVRLKEWGRSGMRLDAFCGCCNPIHLARLGADRIVTGEKGIPRIKVYDSAGEMISVVAGPDAFGVDGKTFSPTVEIRDLAVDSRERVLVLDGRRNVIRVFYSATDVRK